MVDVLNILISFDSNDELPVERATLSAHDTSFCTKFEEEKKLPGCDKKTTMSKTESKTENEEAKKKKMGNCERMLKSCSIQLCSLIRSWSPLLWNPIRWCNIYIHIISDNKFGLCQ